MTTLARNTLVLVACSAATWFVGCGGRANDDDPGNGQDGNGTTTMTPVPTCVEICRTVVDRCFPGGVITQCTSDCEAMRTRYKGCSALDAFMRCMPEVPVLCSSETVTIDGCYEERTKLGHCPSP
jgi:hypothetical protein